MKAVGKIKAVALGTVIAVGMLVVLFGALLASDCVQIESKEPSSETLDAPSAQGAAAATDQEEKASEFFGAFPAKSYTSFEEAEQAAGYHIPRASPDYPLALGVTHLQWFPQFDRPLSETHYTYPPLPSTFIYVIVMPSYFSRDPSDWTSGRAMTVGGKAGWMPPDDSMFRFSYPCGQVDGYEVWCHMRGDKKIGWEAFDHFVSTLQ